MPKVVAVHGLVHGGSVILTLQVPYSGKFLLVQIFEKTRKWL